MATRQKNLSALDRNKSPVGWYIGTYLVRFVEIGAKKNNSPKARFPAWWNTVVVKASSLNDAYNKVAKIGHEYAAPYKGGIEAIPVQWRYVGITNLLPIYEELEDGSEVCYCESKTTLKKLLKAVKKKSEFYQ